jgi:uncharacterized protein (TIGR00251 family)
MNLSGATTEISWREDQDGVLLPIRVKPRARKNGTDGCRNGSLVIAVSAAPVDGAANDAVIEVLCDVLHCSKSALTIVRGHKSRDKTVRAALSADIVRRRLQSLD